MNYKSFYSVVFLLLFWVNVPFAQSLNYCEQAKEMVQTIEKWHYAPKSLDTTFSSHLFADCIELLDGDGFIFSDADIQILANDFKYRLAEEVTTGNCVFVSKVSAIYEKRVKALEKLTLQFADQPFQFLKEETLRFPDQENRVNEQTLLVNWKKRVKLKVLYRYFSSDSSLTDAPMQTDKIFEVQKEVVQSLSCELHAILSFQQGVEGYVGSRYLKALATQFDPHTQFFTKEEAESFTSELSKEAASFGITIKKNSVGEVEVTSLIPGSSAWNTNLINEEDVLLEVKEGDKVISFTCLHLSEIEKIIYNGTANILNFHFRKRNGKDFWVELHKEQVDVESNVIKSFVLEGEKKVGYIYLPSFYTEFGTMSYPPKGCANDLATELIRLKREGIEGLVLDLRDNGGGSMDEAIRLVGIFINYGAVCLQDSREGTLETLKDMNRGKVYSDPLVVITNQLSASASELFAAAIQDQHRGVVVGSRTYGKASMQTVIPSNAYAFAENQTNNSEPNAYVKITIGKFYRVTGASHQREGVLPDVMLPNFYDSFEVGEMYTSNSLPSTTVTKKVYYYPSDTLPIRALNALSLARRKGEHALQNLHDLGVQYNQIVNCTNFQVSFEGFRSYYKTLITGLEVKNEVKVQPNFTVANPSYLQGVTSAYNNEEEVNQNSMDEIQSDPTVAESFLILNDLINLSKP